MRNTFPALALALSLLGGAAATLVLSLVAGTTYADAGESGPPPQTKNLLETATAAGSFTTLIKAVETAGLAGALTGDDALTVFAPTDAAFAALPEGTVAALLEPENRAQLARILTFHVVAGSVRSKDLLPSAGAKTLSGDAVPFGLQVGGANVTTADIECSNGVIHVIDAVLLPPAQNGSEADMEVQRALTDAIDRGVPAYNDGDTEACARIYREAARGLLRGDALAELHHMALTDALTAPAEDASAEAWTLRRAFDGVLLDLVFEPHSEAPLPEGFPEAGPVGRVVRKQYPGYRAARAEGGRAFWQLFEHIKKNDVAMTAPVEMTMGDDASMRDMAFLYERPTQGEAGTQGAVSVLDLEPLEVLSIGIRGRRDAAGMARARKAIEQRLAADGLRASGPWRTLGYNSPMVPAARQYWELQVPIE